MSVCWLLRCLVMNRLGAGCGTKQDSQTFWITRLIFLSATSSRFTPSTFTPSPYPIVFFLCVHPNDISSNCHAALFLEAPLNVLFPRLPSASNPSPTHAL